MSLHSYVCNFGFSLEDCVVFYVKFFNKQSKKRSLKCIHLQHVTISISMTFLLNMARLGFVSFYNGRKLKNVGAKYQATCRILGIF